MIEPVLKPSYHQIEDLKADLLHRFEQYLVAGNRKRDTRRIYLSTIRLFFEVSGDPLHPSKTVFHDWLRPRMETLKASTINTDLTVLRVFYKWLYDWEMVDHDWSDVIPKSRRAPNRIPMVFDEHQMGKLLAAPPIDTFVGYRDHVILRLVYETGIRASEVVNLSLGCVNDDRTLFVANGKGGKDRVLPFSEEMAGLLESWYRVRRTVKPGKQYTLFVTHKGRPFTKGRAVWEIVNRYSRQALGLGNGYGRIQKTRKRKPWTGHYPHMLRASMATHMQQNGADLRAVQEMLGHTSLSTTAHYLAVDLTAMRSAIKHHHPRGTSK
ncbi:MAG: tyrosine-type recombinase/integrase [Gammaproteobacteria bacterium]|nr:tyrosine-type recombinase/integrase [Gammaproteobacteria bacterium]